MHNHHRLFVGFSIISAIAGILSIASCMHEVEPGPIIFRCPQLQQYSKDQQLKALAEMRAVDAQIPQTKELLNDYKRLRDACRAMAYTAGLPSP